MYTVRNGVLLLATRDGSGEPLQHVSERLRPFAWGVCVEGPLQRKTEILENRRSLGVSVQPSDSAFPLVVITPKHW